MKRCQISPEEPKEECLHRDSLWGMCILCGEPTVPQIEQTDDQNPNVKKRAVTLEKQAKLSLVLDLDNTLLNSTLLSALTKSEATSLKPQATNYPEPNANSDLFVFEESSKQMMTKLRPFVRTFLEETSRLFDLYVFTMATCDYAADMVRLLDPESRYFDKTRVFTRDNVSYRKGLSIVPVVRSACVIVDDIESAWPNDKSNVIQIDKYNYFASSCSDRKSLSELMTDESEVDGALARVLGVLRRVHHTYFAAGDDDDDSDVREILRSIRKDILVGCTVFFCSCVDDEDDPAYAMDLEMKAVALGATWAPRVDPTVTHVVAADPASEEAVWAVMEGKFLVEPKWIETAHYCWERPSETMYPL